ncbi:MAG: xanthine dehydrogenase family protein molybdopterin-binding subunit [Nitrospinota bacterium]
MGQFTHVGKRVPSVEATDKAQGAGRYVTDLNLPGMLWGKILRSPYPHARLSKLDASRARKLRGVKAVVAGDDPRNVKHGPIIADEYILSKNKVRFAGEEVAAVAAVDLDTAEEALEHIYVEYEELPYVTDPENAVRPGAPAIHDVESNIANQGTIEHGEPDDAFSRSAAVVEYTYRTSAVHQCYMEPMACVAEYDSAGRLTLHLGVQNPWMCKIRYAEILGMSPKDVRVVQSFIGGGFGSKMEHRMHLITALLAQDARRPVRIDHTRGDEFMATRPRVAMTLRVKLGADKDGHVLVKESDVLADNGAYTDYAPAITGIAAYRIDNMYRIPNVRSRYRLAYTNKAPSGGFRGFGNAQGAFALESTMDMLAEKLGMDPADLRLKNVVQRGDTTTHGFYIGSVGLRECIEGATRAIGWSERRNRNGPSGRYRRGIGLACCIHVSGFRGFFKEFDGSSAQVHVNEDGNVYILTGEVDLGQGSRTIMAQIAAEELSLPLESVRVSSVDTDVTPACLGAFATRTTTLGGNAILAAARDARHQLVEHAAEMLECRPEDVRLSNGQVFVEATPDRKHSVAEVARSATFASAGNPVLGKGSFSPPNVVLPAPDKYGNVSTAYPFAAQAAEVEVDMGTGHVRIVRFVAGHDVGKVINELAIEGQVEGGVTQGIGYALMEDIVMHDGSVVNPNFYDYRIPTMQDVPDIETFFVESSEPTGPYGAKGVGEPALVPTAAAVANAIYNAVGVRITSLPITPEKVLESLEEKETLRA